MIVYRATAYHAPLWLEPNFTAGRFHEAGIGPVQYFCLHPLGPLAEALRWQPPGTDPAHVRRAVWALRLPDGPAETIGFDQAAEWGLEPYSLVCPPEGYHQCQHLAETFLAMQDPPMLRVPSASLPGTWNLIAFGVRVAVPYMYEPVDPALDVPVSLMGVEARILKELAPLVRPLNALPHAAHDAWQNGEEFEFMEPITFSLGG